MLLQKSPGLTGHSRARSRGISGEGKRLCSHRGVGPHSVPPLSSGPGASNSGWTRTSAWAAEGTPAPVLSPILTGVREGRRGHPNNQHPCNCLHGDSRLHSRLPASCPPSSLATLPFPGGRNLVSLFAATSPWMQDPSWTRQSPCGSMQVE